jgi:hypothetical protein
MGVLSLIEQWDFRLEVIIPRQLNIPKLRARAPRGERIGGHAFHSCLMEKRADPDSSG